MPTIPQVSAPEEFNTPLNPAHAAPQHLSPTLAPTIRADVHMYDGEFGALTGVGEAVEGMGELDFRIKRANVFGNS